MQTNIEQKEDGLQLDFIEGETLFVPLEAEFQYEIGDDAGSSTFGDVTAMFNGYTSRQEQAYNHLHSGSSSGSQTLTGYQIFTETVTMTQGVTAPNDATTHAYAWNRTGNLVTMFLRLNFNGGGAGVMELKTNIPNDMPLPDAMMNEEDAANGSIIAVGNCNWGDTQQAVGLGYAYIINSGSRTDAIRINHTAQPTKFYQVVLQYISTEA